MCKDCSMSIDLIVLNKIRTKELWNNSECFLVRWLLLKILRDISAFHRTFCEFIERQLIGVWCVELMNQLKWERWRSVTMFSYKHVSNSQKCPNFGITARLCRDGFYVSILKTVRLIKFATSRTRRFAFSHCLSKPIEYYLFILDFSFRFNQIWLLNLLEKWKLIEIFSFNVCHSKEYSWWSIFSIKYSTKVTYSRYLQNGCSMKYLTCILRPLLSLNTIIIYLELKGSPAVSIQSFSVVRYMSIVHFVS